MTPRSETRSSPKYTAVLNDLAAKIERGELAPDTPLPAIRTLMKTYGYSLVTITRAIEILETRGLVYCVRGKGVFVQPRRFTPPVAVSPEPRPHLQVGVVSSYPHPRPGEMWWSRILSGVDAAVHAGAGRVHVRLVHVEGRPPAEVVARCARDGLNALLNLGDHWRGGDLLAFALAAREARLPVVMAWTSQPRPLPLHLVEIDNLGGVLEAVDHLVALGHRRIAFLGSEQPYPWIAERLEAFRLALAGHGLAPAREERLANAPIQSIRPGDLDFRALCDEATAVVAANDDAAALLLRWCAERGVDVPGRLSVVGFDDDPIYRQLELTTVHDDLERVGRASLALLERLLAEDAAGALLNVRLPARLVPRRTTGSPRATLESQAR